MKPIVSSHAVDRFIERVQWDIIPTRHNVYRTLTYFFHNGMKMNVGMGSDFLVKVPRLLNDEQFYLCCKGTEEGAIVKSIISEEQAIVNYQSVMRSGK